jgi:predicted DNA-binding transcriptional regulator YafY
VGDHPADEVERRVRLVQIGARTMALPHFETVANAVLKRERMRIVYAGRNSDEVTEREVSPQRLVHYRDNWYVDAWCHLRDALRSFAVDAIRDATLLDRKAKTIADRELDEVLGSGYGIFSGRATQWARLRFTPARARWVGAEQWHPRQKGSFEADGAYVLEVPYSDDRELIGDILRHGPEVEVLDPPALRRAVREQLNATLKRYKE